MWTYRQSTGVLRSDSRIEGAAYSGHGEGLNNPAMESVHGVGPIPAGRWRVGPWEDHHGHLGPCVAHLTPVGHDAHGRTAFFVHGDNWKANHTGSDGCIVAGPAIRHAWQGSGDSDLEVIP